MVNFNITYNDPPLGFDCLTLTPFECPVGPPDYHNERRRGFQDCLVPVLSWEITGRNEQQCIEPIQHHSFSASSPASRTLSSSAFSVELPNNRLYSTGNIVARSIAKGRPRCRPRSIRRIICFQTSAFAQTHNELAELPKARTQARSVEADYQHKFITRNDNVRIPISQSNSSITTRHLEQYLPNPVPRRIGRILEFAALDHAYEQSPEEDGPEVKEDLRQEVIFEVFRE
jgi:hypothetical protein